MLKVLLRGAGGGPWIFEGWTVFPSADVVAKGEG